MAISYMEMIRGYPYKTPSDLAKEIHKTTRTVSSRIKDLKAEMPSGRYSQYSIIEDEGITLVNVVVFLDFLKYRKALTDKNARKYVPDFNPREMMELCGWSMNPVILESAKNETA